MRYRRLKLSCPCGRSARQFAAIGITLEGQLVISWRCVQCKNWIHFVKPLSDYLQQCATDMDTVMETLNIAPAVEAEDVRFLRSLGVRYPEDADPL